MQTKFDKEIDGYRELIEKLGGDEPAVFGTSWKGGYLIQQNPYEFSRLLAFLPKEIDVYLEIGTASGGSCRAIYETRKIGTVISIDDGRHSHSPQQETNLSGMPLIKFRGDSHSPECSKWLEELGLKVNVAFIDGDHSYAGVKQDTEMVLPHMAKDGLLIYHDTVCVPDIKNYMSELVSLGYMPVARYVDESKPVGITVFKTW